jgi:hypothetical protein
MNWEANLGDPGKLHTYHSDLSNKMNMPGMFSFLCKCKEELGILSCKIIKANWCLLNASCPSHLNS